MHLRPVIVRVTVGIVLAGAGYVVGRAQQPLLKSGIVSSSQTVVADSGAWGEFRRHYIGQTPTLGEVMAGYADINAGSEPHPPHTHLDEEFLYLVEGSGVWSIDGKESPAKAGDVLYSAPNVSHGIRNTSDKPLRFFVVKWRGK